MERVAAKLPLLTKRVTQPARERDALSRLRHDLGGAAAEEGDEFGGEFFAEAPHVEKSGSIRVTDTFNAAEVVEQGFATHGAEAGEIVENLLADFAGAEIGVVGVGEAVGFVAQAL